MTEELKTIWRKADRIEDPDVSDAVEYKLLNAYLTETKYIIPEEDWYEIQTRGYDIDLLCQDADDDHPEWRPYIMSALDEIINEENRTAEFFRGYDAGTNASEIEENLYK